MERLTKWRRIVHGTTLIPKGSFFDLSALGAHAQGEACQAAPYRPRVSKTLSAVGFLFLSWSFLPIGIGEHPASDSLVFDGLVSLHSLSYLWVSGRLRLHLTLPFSDFFSLLSLS